MQQIGVIPASIVSRIPNPALHVLNASQAADLNPHSFIDSILWGWKRDNEKPRLSRLIYFSGNHTWDTKGTWVENPFLFYAHWGEEEAMESVVSQLQEEFHGSFVETTSFEVLHPAPKTTLVRIISGKPDAENFRRLSMLASRQPEPPVPTPPHIASMSNFDLKSLGVTGCDLLAGSGLSYEAGLPMLKDVHDLFWVDDGYEGFCLGGKDLMPSLLRHDLEGMFRSFTGWHVQAAKTQPTEAHKCLFQLHRAGFLHNVYTDNIDKLFPLTGFENSTKVRGSGVVNEFFPTNFHSDSNVLLIVGVSADRRGIIAQARQRHLKLVVINPYIPVSPGAKNLNYLQDGDIYYRLSAGEALPKIVANTLK